MRAYARKTDATQAEIVSALRKAGWKVWLIQVPCDALCWKAGHGFKTLEFKVPNRKDGTYRVRKDQKEQADFCATTGTKYVTTPEQALEALG